MKENIPEKKWSITVAKEIKYLVKTIIEQMIHIKRFKKKIESIWMMSNIALSMMAISLNELRVLTGKTY